MTNMNQYNITLNYVIAENLSRTGDVIVTLVLTYVLFFSVHDFCYVFYVVIIIIHDQPNGIASLVMFRGSPTGRLQVSLLNLTHTT
jgi:hypothetical protein